METETENGNGKRKRKAESGKGKWSSQQYVHSTSYQCQSSSSKSSLGRCKTWILDWTHELTDIWTLDKAIIDDMTHMPCMLCIQQPCPSSVQCTSGIGGCRTQNEPGHGGLST